MSRIFEVYAREALKSMEAEDLSLSMWPAYPQLESERFVCKDSDEVWHRFESVTVYTEDEYYPEGDLVKEREKVARGFVCWKGGSGTIPEIGDVFRVFDCHNQVLFEETIVFEEILHGKSYAAAEKAAPFTQHLLNELEVTLRDGLDDTFTINQNTLSALKFASSNAVSKQEKIEFVLRGIPFVLLIDEYKTHSPCTITYFDVDGQTLHGLEGELDAGDKWYKINYRTKNGGEFCRCIGWGIGEAKDAIPQVLKIFKNLGFCRLM